MAQASEQFGVDPQIIVAIIGVETFYGRITGGYRVLDALATLSFYYPDTGNDRSDFFSRELMQFMLLGDEEGLPLREVSGSYAGAMGLGQFMPSSYREYAVDLDGDGRRDLWSSMPDIIGSVANYLHRHGWQPGRPVAQPARVAPDADMSLVARRDFKAQKTLAELEAAHQGHTLKLSGELEQLTNLESRVTILGHLQRGGTPSAADRLLATRLGSACAELIHQGTQHIFEWHLVVFPLMAICATLMLTAFVGEAVREAFDPKKYERLR